MPGGFAEMILFGGEKGGNVRALSLVHATRILTLVSLTPFIINIYLDIDLSVAPGVRLLDIPAKDLVIMAVCAFVGYHGAMRIGMFGASVLGPMILSALASILGLIENRPPTEALILAQFVIGISIGSHYVGVTRDELRHVISASVGYALILAALTLAFGEIIYLLGIKRPAARHSGLRAGRPARDGHARHPDRCGHHLCHLPPRAAIAAGDEHDAVPVAVARLTPFGLSPARHATGPSPRPAPEAGPCA